MVRLISVEPNPMVEKDATCRGCGAKMKYVPNDVRNRSYKDYTGCSEVVEFINCPNCAQEVIVRQY